MPANPYESDESTTANVPAVAHHPPDVSRPDSTATPSSPKPTPIQRIRATGSCGRSQMPRTNANSGTVACAMPATDESMCCSPHAISQNGKRRVEDPVDHRLPPVRAQLVPHPRRAPRREDEPEQDRAGEQRAPAISTAGATSSTPTLMKKYDEPHRAASRNSLGRYPRIVDYNARRCRKVRRGALRSGSRTSGSSGRSAAFRPRRRRAGRSRTGPGSARARHPTS